MYHLKVHLWHLSASNMLLHFLYIIIYKVIVFHLQKQFCVMSGKTCTYKIIKWKMGMWTNEVLSRVVFYVTFTGVCVARKCPCSFVLNVVLTNC